MKNYTVYLKDYTTGANSPIDTITAPDNYTAEKYINDCNNNSDPEYIAMLQTGEITIIENN